MPSKPRYLTAKQAAESLGISVNSLYAYVSRGLIRSEPGEESSRQRRYLAEDVEKLRERKEFQRDPAKVVESSLHWGMPMLDSAITLITDEKLYYRGYEVAQLATQHTVEQVAALIWTGSMDEADNLFNVVIPQVERLAKTLPPIQHYQVLLASVDDLAAYDLRPASVARTGAKILKLLAAASGGTGNMIADVLQSGWCPHLPQAARLLNAALILCADHELNVSTFTARVIASSEANPYAVVIGGLSAIQGFRHGGNTERVEGFLREAGTPDAVPLVIADRMRRGERIPGFGHLIYKHHGDPRAVVLMRLLEAEFPDSPALALCHAAIDRMREIGVAANIDLSLAAMAQTLGLPRGGALAVFALGRVIGWIGHAIEQYADDKLIRPRARYVGNPPHGI